jgi:cell wall-associated NlpC family hydrolase
MTSTAMAEAQARVAQIQAQIAAMRPSPPRAQATTRAAASDFASALGHAESEYRPGGAEVDGSDVVANATRYLGTPYRWGGADPETGLDCSGFVQQVYDDLGIDLPRVSRDQARVGTAVPDLASAKAGDLIAFGDPVDHIGIYIGHGRMIVSPHTGDVVKVQDVPGDWTAIRRVLTDSPTATGLPGTSPYAALFESAGARHGISPAILAAVAQAESGNNPRAVSHAGAQGLMQLMPATARGLGVDAFDPAQAVDGAARLLSSHLEKFGSLPLALAAYNAGPGAVSRYGGIPPYQETQGYVARILDDLRSEAS